MLVTSKSARDLAMGENEPCRSPLAITCDSSGYTNIRKGGTKTISFAKPKREEKIEPLLPTDFQFCICLLWFKDRLPPLLARTVGRYYYLAIKIILNCLQIGLLAKPKREGKNWTPFAY